MFYLVFSNVFILNKRPNALNVHIYDWAIHLAELCEFREKTKQKKVENQQTYHSISNLSIFLY